MTDDLEQALMRIEELERQRDAAVCARERAERERDEARHELERVRIEANKGADRGN
jgi:hypothetical protein